MYDPTPFCTHELLCDCPQNCNNYDSCTPTQRCQVKSLEHIENLLYADIKPFPQLRTCRMCGIAEVSCNESKWTSQTIVCQPVGTPIIIDVRGNGYSLTDRTSGVVFDLFSLLLRSLVSWTAPDSDDAFLVLDRNGNGVIDNGSELFGNVTPQPLTWGDPNGFKALAVFDTRDAGGNGDDSIDNKDSVWQRLKLWSDFNHNGVSESDELVRLADAPQIEGIDLDYKLSKRTDQYGNLFRYRAKVRGKKIARWAYDVYLRVS